MDSRINAWETELNAITREFMAFKKLTPEQFNFKPDSRTWSIAQNVDHLIVLNETYNPILDSVQKGTFKAPFMGRFASAVNFFGKLIYDAVEPTRKRKGKTLGIWLPTASTIGLDILDRFEKHQQELLQRIKQSEPALVKGVIIHSPGSKMIVYKLERAFEIIVSHERRHLNQAKEMLKTIRS